MKTLHLTNAWSASSGGIATFYRALFEAADREDHHMRLVVPSDSTRLETVGRNGRIYHLAAPRAPLNHHYRVLCPYRFLFPNTAVQRIINEERPDLLEVSEKYTLPFLAGLLRTGRLPGVTVRPVVLGVSHERMDENVAAYVTTHPSSASFCRWYMKAIYFPMFDHHIAVSEHTAGELIEASHGHKVRRGIWVSPMGVDYERFTNERRRPECRANLLRQVHGAEDTTVLLYAGRLSPEKNVSLLAAMMERLNPRDFRLCIAGDGPLAGVMRQQCNQRNLSNVVFLGHIANRDTLADLYANADVFVHPNPREPFGIAPLEAMVAGLPLIAPNAGGVTSYANADNAWLINPDSASFAAAAQAIRDNPQVSTLRIRNARTTASQFRWSLVTTRFLNLCQELIAVTRHSHLTPKIAPLVWSTPGDFLGREISFGH